MPEENEPDVEIVNDEPEAPETPSTVTVDLDPKPAQKQDEKPKYEAPKSNADIQKLNNTIAYYARKHEKTEREIAELKALLASRQQTITNNQEPEDEIDREAQRDWKKGVKLVVDPYIDEKVDKYFKDREEKARQEQILAAREQELEKAKNRVVQRYPEIEVTDSEEQRLYLEVLNEDKSLLRIPQGPEIAMYRMEEKMRELGRIPQSVKPVLDKEMSRLTRAGASSVVGRQANGNGKITLTAEQKKFCDNNGIDYTKYAQNLKAQEARGGIEA